MKVKRCSRCGEHKAASGFYRWRAASDGLQRLCKRCHVDANRASRARRREREGAGYNREVRREEARLYRENNREAKRVSNQEWKGRNQIKVMAHRAVYRAVAEGVLVRPEHCERCGRDESPVEAHHADYGAPLEVEWLCVPCHQARHHVQQERAA